ncbi:MAG: PA14 domain-containing protein [Clostridia bacterium]|nr:PA14 domain-containing protein [Clostridia bacterium]
MGKRLSTLVAILMLFIFPVQTFAIANESILNRISSDSTIAKNEKSDKKESKLGIPKNLKAELIGTTVFVKWNKESKATGYDIEIDGVVKDNKKSNTYIHKNLEPKSWHTYRVRARYSTEVSEWSNPVKKVVAAPVKPILEYVVLNSDGTCTAFWGWLNINSFSIDVPQADSMFTGTVTDETTIPPAVFSSGLQIDKFSTVFSGDTLVWTIKNPDGTTLKATANKSAARKPYISAPVSISADADFNSVTVTWNKVNWAAGYDIEVDGVIVNNSTDTKYVHKNITPGTAHKYRVRTRGIGTASYWSSVVDKTTLLDKPLNVIVKPNTTYITIGWDKVEGATSYDVEENGTVIYSGQDTEYTHADIIPGTMHSYTVKAKTAFAESEKSQPVTAITLLDTPSGLSTVCDETSITLAWNPVAGADGYEAEADGTAIDVGEATSYRFSGLNPGTQHVYRVRAKTAYARSEWSDIASQVTKLGVPSYFNVTPSGNEITLTWDGVAGAESYEIEVDGNVIENGTNTSYVHTGLLPGTTHTYRVKAKNSLIAGEWSGSTTVNTLFGIPQNVTASVTEDSILTQWNAVDGAVGYDIEVNGTITDNGTSTSYTISDVTPGYSYVYRVRARTAFIVGNWSVPVNAVIPVGVPQNVSCAATENTITVIWEAIKGAEGYDVEVDGSVIDAGNVTSYTHDGLIPGGNHVYRVRAKAGNALGEYSNAVAKATLLGIPSGITESVNGDSLTITWEPVTGATGYDIEINENLADNAEATTYTISGIVPGTQYVYRVRAKTQDVTGDWSDSVTNSTSLGTPSNISSVVNETGITIIWDAVSGATSYEIEVNGTVVELGDNTSYTDINPLPGTVYSFRVRAKTAVVSGEWSIMQTRVTQLGVPDNFRAFNTESTITLEWDTVPGATGYDVEIDDGAIVSVQAPSFTHESLEAGSEHTYRVRARNDSATGEWSVVIGTISKISKPSTPQNINTSPTDNTITVTWDKAEGASGYEVEADGVVIKCNESTSFVHNGLYADTQYTYRVRAVNGSGASGWSAPVVQRTNFAPVGIGKGLKAEYFNGWNLDTKKLTRIDSTVNFNWGTGTPDSSVKSEFFSARWTGYVQPRYTTTYKFYVFGDNGVRLWVNGQKIVDRWTNSFGEEVGTVDLVAGQKYEIRLEYFDYTGAASVKLMWSCDRLAKEIIPQSQLYCPTPDSPANILSLSSESEISITWDSVLGAEKYDIEINGAYVGEANNNNYLHTKLLPDTQYVYRVRAKNNSGAGEWSAPVTVRTLPAQGNGTGLKAEYFNGWNLDTKKLTRIDSAVNFNWGTGSPDTSVKSEFFSARWTGYVLAKYTGTYKFHAFADNGVRLWVNGQKIIDRWTDSFGEEVGTIDLVAGQKYEIRLEYFDYTGAASVKLMWSSDKQSKEVIPQSYLYLPVPETPSGISANGTETTITVTWGSVIEAEGYDIEVDGTVISNGTGTSYTHTGLQPDSQHTYRVRAKNSSGTGEWSSALAKRTLLAPVGNGNGLSAEYFNGWNLDTKILTRIDSSIDFNWGTGSPDTSVKNEFFSVRWTGYVEPRYTGTYKFHAFADNGVRLWVNGQKIIDRWTDSFGEEVGTIDLTAGQKYEIRLEYFDYTGAASMKLMWSCDRLAKEIIPQSQLYSPVPEIPLNLKFSNTDSLLTWDTVIGAEYYEIEVDGLVAGSTANTSFTLSDELSGTQHVYRVRAKNSSGTGEWSLVAVANT